MKRESQHGVVRSLTADGFSVLWRRVIQGPNAGPPRIRGRVRDRSDRWVFDVVLTPNETGTEARIGNGTIDMPVDTDEAMTRVENAMRALLGLRRE